MANESGENGQKPLFWTQNSPIFQRVQKKFLEHLYTFVLAPFRPLNHQNSEGKTQDMLKKFSKKQQLPTGLKSALYCTVKSPKMTAPSSNPSIT